MIDQLKKIIKSEFKRSNAKAFFFFLVFSSILWLLVQFSKTYTEVVEIPLQFVEYPKDKLIETKTDNLRVEVEQNGFQLAWLNFFKPSMKVNLSDLPADSSYLVYNLPEHRMEIARKLSLDIIHANFLDTEVRIPYETKSIKRVPVISKVEVNYAPGYSSESKGVIVPDSVTISGPSSVLDTIMHISTVSAVKRRVDKNLASKVKLEKIDPKVAFYEDAVEFQLEVQKFTERKMKIPLTAVNAPTGVTINLFPTVVEITFMISVEKYELVKPIDFNIVCDFSEISEEQDFFIPKVETQPDFIKNISISPRKVHYIIKR